MYAMQYRIGLPADYDMRIIRHRVESKGHLLDELPGLGLKAYLITEAGTDGAAVNQYAPFYLWTDVRQMGTFLWGNGGFQGIVNSFGRPPVSHWTGVAFRLGRQPARSPSAATLQVTAIERHTDPREAVGRARDALASDATSVEMHCAALVVDPTRWEMVQLTLWNDRVAGPGERFTVLHTSTPDIHALAERPR